ncbi:hypothetical protein FSARC_5750 [Fusarium sarcochroum]|uniref:Uncharacterized protein n=1 Tax=Fusarium sarcochroum TaxID=1208366 RepID=A0A8H4XA31_9HYPO|nr:hypothetical protein FSARC_5750 [Fusarium sarcochroum]
MADLKEKADKAPGPTSAKPNNDGPSKSDGFDAECERLWAEFAQLNLLPEHMTPKKQAAWKRLQAARKKLQAFEQKKQLFREEVQLRRQSIQSRGVICQAFQWCFKNTGKSKQEAKMLNHKLKELEQERQIVLDEFGALMALAQENGSMALTGKAAFEKLEEKYESCMDSSDLRTLEKIIITMFFSVFIDMQEENYTMGDEGSVAIMGFIERLMDTINRGAQEKINNDRSS